MVQRIPALRGFWDLKKTELRKIRVRGTNMKISHLHIDAKNRGSGICGSETM